MKVKTVYECEKCGQGYDNEEMCKECEINHLAPLQIISSKSLHYRSPFDYAYSKYPLRIRVLMENGEIVTYYIERVGSTEDK